MLVWSFLFFKFIAKFRNCREKIKVNEYGFELQQYITNYEELQSVVDSVINEITEGDSKLFGLI